RSYDQMAAALSYLAWDLAILGFSDQATKASEQALAWAKGLSRPFALAFTHLYISQLDQFRGDVQAAQDQSASDIGIVAEYGFPWPTSYAIVIRGWVQSCQGEAENGIAQMRRGVADAEASGFRSPSWLLVPLVETYLRIGRTEEAGQLLAQTLETSDQTDGRMQEAELYRLKGELSLKASGSEGKAESCFRRAIKIAQRQSAKLWEPRTTMSLARLLAQQGKHDEARTMLAEI